MQAEKLMPLREWLKIRFTTPPDVRTAQKWCENGDIPAKKMGSRWYIVIDEELNQTGDPLVDNVLMAAVS